jgi:hypothetical protein
MQLFITIVTGIIATAGKRHQTSCGPSTSGLQEHVRTITGDMLTCLTSTLGHLVRQLPNLCKLRVGEAVLAELSWVCRISTSHGTRCQS